MNSNKEEYKKYFDILELSSDATLQEVKKTYHFLKNLYSTESIVTIPAEGEISEEESKAILDQIEEAYQMILTLYEVEKQSRAKDLAKVISEVTVFDGKTLKMIRESLNIKLQDISFSTKVSVKHLENIEEENFSALPVYAYTRGFVVAYAKCLSLSPDKVAQDYLEKFNAWKNEQESKPTKVYQQKWL